MVTKSIRYEDFVKFFLLGVLLQAVAG